MATNGIDRPYTQAMELLNSNTDDRVIMASCGISRAELDLVKRLMVFARPNLRIDAKLSRIRGEGNK